MDNIHLATEIMRGYDVKRGVPRCTIKIDLRKAYDTINWEFLEAVLHGLNFHPLFIQRIMECVTSPSFSIAVNGSSHGFFRGKRGLRQGDPMSPSLFILCMEYLSRLLCARTSRHFNYHPKCINLRITHLAFADDLMLFGRGDPISMRILADTMQEFSACSGLEVNQGKSNVFMSGTMTPNRMEELKNIFGFPIAKLPIKYLGIPLASRMLKTADYAQLIDKLTATTIKWKGKSLSFAGRLELIRSVLQGVESYWLQAFPLPDTVITRLVAIAREFLWGSKHANVAWKDICLPKEEGGLGIRNLGTWNTALHAKILWNLHAKKDTLWIQWVHTEIIRNATIWDWRPRVKQDSQLMKRIISIRDEMLQKCSRDEAANLWTKWSNNPKGTQEAYEWFRSKDERRFWAKFVWKDFIPPKYSFITWLAIRGRLLTRDRIRYMTIDRTCPICNSCGESIEHLFFKCPETKKVWEEIRFWIGLFRRISTIKSAIKWTAREKTGSAIVQKARRIALMTSVNFIWKARNAHIFDGKPFDAIRLVYQVKSTTYSLLYSLYSHEQVIAHLPEK